MGDLSENGAYKAARFELSDTDRNIRRLTHLLKFAEVYKQTTTDMAGFGNTVTLTKEAQSFTYRLVSQYEADPMKGLISVESPIGKAILGKRIGDTAHVQAPVGIITYIVTKIV
jgi:transcription elongation factor GreA